MATRGIAPYFQPIVDIGTGELRGFEVLARWLDPDQTAIGPDVFIPLARAHDLLAELTLSIVWDACTVAAEWPGNFYVAFNLPPALLQDAAAVDAFISTARSTGFPLHRIRVEMTEVEVVENEAAAEFSIAQLGQLGIKTMLDDFGTGYSSLVRLQRFSFEKIKIEGSFIRSLESDEASRKIVSAIVGLGKSLGATVVAESVENRFQLEFLAGIGCDAYQGWLLAPAMDAAQTTAWLADYRPARLRLESPRLSPYQRQYQLETLYEHSPVGLAFIGPDLHFVAANARFCAMHVLPHAEIVGHHFTEVVPAGLQPLAAKLIMQGVYAGISDVREIRMPGRRQTFLFSHDSVTDAGGVVLGLSVVCIDVTEAKQYEQALQAYEASSLDVTGEDRDVLWIAETSGEVIYVTPHVADDQQTALRHRIGAWHRRIEPTDRDRVKKQWRRSSAGSTEFVSQFRVRCSGGWRPMVIRARLLGRGGSARWFGFLAAADDRAAIERRSRFLDRIGAGQASQAH